MSAGTNTSTFEIYRGGDELCIVLKGRVVLEDLGQIKEVVLSSITREIENVYLDLQSVDYIDSAGLGLLISFKMASKMHGAGITLMDPNKNVADVLAVSRIDGIFEFLSGEDSNAIRDRLVQPDNMLKLPHKHAGSTKPAGGEGSFPQVTSDGAVLDLNDETTQTREAVEEQCRRAVEAMRQGDYEKSIECYKSALQLDAEYLPALNNLAIVYEKQPGWHDLAIETWKRVLELSRQRKDTKHTDRAERHLADLAE